MRKNLFSILFFLFLFSEKASSKEIEFLSIAFSNVTDTVPTYLANLTLENFINKPIDSFLTKIPVNYNRMEVFGGHNPKIASKLLIFYPNNVLIVIYSRNFQFITPRSETLIWDTNLFRKEKASQILIFDGAECINGCSDNQ